MIFQQLEIYFVPRRVLLPESFDAEHPSLGRLSGLEHPAYIHASRELSPSSLRPPKASYRKTRRGNDHTSSKTPI